MLPKLRPLNGIPKDKEKIMLALPILKTSAKSVQTTAEVCADYTCSLYRLQLKSPESTTYLQIYVRVLTKVNTRTHRNAGQPHQNNKVYGKT